MERQNHFIPAIESLRGMAAMSVLIGHCYVFSPKWSPPNDLMGLLLQGIFDPQPPVILFFVISGLVLALQLRADPPDTLGAYLAYLVRRAFRILPAMWVAVIFSFAMLYDYRNQPAIDWQHIARTLYLQDVDINGALWSLQVELMCSLLFPVLYLMHHRLNFSGKLLLLLVLAALAWRPNVPFGLQFLVCFQVGLIASEVKNWPGSVSLLAVGIVGCVWAPEITMGSNKVWVSFNDWTWVAGPSCFLIVAYIVNAQAGIVIRALGSRVLRFLGRISYSVYLIHLPILLLCREELVRLSLDGLPDQWLTLVIMAVTISITLPLATLLYYWIERPFIRLGRLSAKMLSLPGAAQIAR